MSYTVLPGGVSIDWAVAKALMALEDRGATFQLVSESGEVLAHVKRGTFHGAVNIRVLPPGLLTADERAYLIANKAEVLKVVAYQADDSHL